MKPRLWLQRPAAIALQGRPPFPCGRGRIASARANGTMSVRAQVRHRTLSTVRSKAIHVIMWISGILFMKRKSCHASRFDRPSSLSEELGRVSVGDGRVPQGRRSKAPLHWLAIRRSSLGIRAGKRSRDANRDPRSALAKDVSRASVLGPARRYTCAHELGTTSARVFVL